MRCSKCGSENPAGKRFCGDCGEPLNDGPSVQPQSPGERRHLTVLFCDLVGSTEIAARLDPEEWRDIVASYHHATAGVITRFGGHVAHYFGDGVMAYFGWPEAHENDAERAARAGLAILEAVAKLNQESTEPHISVRVGIDSGLVVVGAGAGKDADVFGETPNIAARVQTAAAPNSVLITAATHRLFSGLFVVEEAGAQQLKGIASPVVLYRIERPTGVRSRIGVRGLTPFVGREEELRLLLSRWERVRESEGRAVLAIGEAGIGKSRLLAEFHDRIRDTPHIWMESAGEQFFEHTPFHALSQMLSRWLELQSLGGEQRSRAKESVTCALEKEQFERLERALASAALRVEETAPLICELLQLPVRERYPQLKLTPEEKRRRLLAALAGWAFGAARLQPVVMVVEDLHWADPSTLELVQLLAEQGVMVPLMLMCTARPEFHAPWPQRKQHTQITLNRLSASNVRKMITQVAARSTLASETIDAVIERSSGVPLFAEELTRAVLEGATVGVSTREIPATLHDSLMSRLDRLGPAKEILQIGAVIGSGFPYELLQAVHPISEGSLLRALRRLVDAELLYVHGIAPDATYQFKHALIRDAAYNALLKSRRRDLHRLIAQTISEKFQALKATQPEVLARHWAEAGETEQAIVEWSRAGKAAEARNAFIEAQESLLEALALLNLLPESRERDVRELELRQSLVLMLYMTRGWSAPETADVVARVGVLAERSGDLLRLLESMTMRCFYAYIAGDLSAAAALADEALELALGEGDPSALASLYTMQVLVHYFRGELADAENHFVTGLKFFDDPVFRQNPEGTAIAVFGWASWNAWILGRPDVARERLAKMRAAVNPANPHDIAWSDVLAAVLHNLIREHEIAEGLAERALNLCEKHQFPNEAAVSRCLLGYARAELGRAADGIALIRQGIDELVQIGNRLSETGRLTNLANAQLRAGAIGDALETVEQALNFNPDNVVGLPETLRIRGELRLRHGDRQLAEADFRESISRARTMGAKAWELRATMSLARLLRDTGRREETRAMLAEIYNWFTEGFDTADLKEAKALLDELS